VANAEGLVKADESNAYVFKTSIFDKLSTVRSLE
jgi:hypothetical protein